MQGGSDYCCRLLSSENCLFTNSVHAPLRVVAEHALSRTQNTGRPLSDWEFKDAEGRALDLSRKVGDYHFAGGAVLYLTPTVGANGARR